METILEEVVSFPASGGTNVRTVCLTLTACTLSDGLFLSSDVCSLASYCPELQIIGDPPSRNMFLPAKLYTDREDHITLVSNCAVVTKAISTWRLIGVPFLSFSNVMCNIPTHAAVFTYNLRW